MDHPGAAPKRFPSGPFFAWDTSVSLNLWFGATALTSERPQQATQTGSQSNQLGIKK
jgi:hypothetical protein